MSEAHSMQIQSEDTGAPPSLAATEGALCRGTLYAALALGFREPTDETITRLAEHEAVEALADAARAWQERDGGAGLDAAASALARRKAALGELVVQHRRLFGHTARGEVPPYETEYGEEALFQQPQELSDLAGFLRAFGLAVRNEARERVDHVSCECEFLSFLAFKEAYAIRAGDEEMRVATAGATRSFLRDHLARFTPAFARQLERNDPHGFYGALGRLLLAVVSRDCGRLGVPIGPERLGLRPDPAAVAAPMGCAAAEDEDGIEPGQAGE